MKKLISSILLVGCLSGQCQVTTDTKCFYLGFTSSVLSAGVLNEVSDRPAISAACGLAIGSGLAFLTPKDPGHTVWGSVIGATVISCKFNFDANNRKKRKHKYLNY